MGIVTVVASAHTEFFGSLDEVQAEKSALVRAIPPEGRNLNADDARVLAMREQAAARVLTYGTSGAADVRAVGPAVETAHDVRFVLAMGGQERSVRLAFAGRHNVVNALAAAGAGRALGLGRGQIAAGLEAAYPAKGRCVWRRSGGITILDDTYNANPSSLGAALDTLAAGAGAARRVVVLGDMLELGAGAEAATETRGAPSPHRGWPGSSESAPRPTAVEAARRQARREPPHGHLRDTVVLLLKRLVPGGAP